MKKFHLTQIVSGVVFILLMLACNKPTITEPEPEPEPEPNPISKLPKATEDGLNTFGCLIGGEPFVARVDWNIGGAIEVWADFNEETGLFRTQGTKETGEANFEDLRFKSILTEGPGEYKMYSETDEYYGYNGYGYMCSYYHDPSNYGTLNITYLNTELDIISGTFEMTLINDDCQNSTTLNITEGRFDLRY